ncbi:MAG TPA: phospholipase D-like domain-containing protein [Sandaracinaceae bacterium LLY-WYZ-13_1]|nr:phospholipase D-like domain-containing protein [Sandaracinaceae bacterium LLY-WYZ-13_1]
MRFQRALGVLFSVLALGGCASEASPDGMDEIGVIPGGKADGSDYSACELDEVVAWLNEGPSADAIADAGVHSRAAANLAEHRDGPDATFGTEDDDRFDDIGEVDGVWWVGPVAIRQLVEVVAPRCEAPGAPATEVIFSPQPSDSTHLVRVVELIDGAERSIDVAMYSFRDASILDALERAHDRGVSIRFLFESANGDRSDPEGSRSAQLEDLGIEVRYVNKIMHHKLAIIDGARTDVSEAADGILITGSGNWSSSAGTRYDENTVIVHGNEELNLRYQREFNHLWEHSRDFVWNEDIAPIDSVPVEESDIPDDPTVDALFTSANFRTYESSRYGPTFSTVRGRNEVADRWVELIRDAERSIVIASGHLRSRPIAEALLEAHDANPDLDIRVYLDGQEYLSEWGYDEQQRDLEECLVEAEGSEARTQDCYDTGFLFSYELHHAGVPLRFKYYAYRWHYSYAEQMHHKYMIVDDEILVTGSYNLSDNAEHNTMENVAIFTGESHRALIDAYRANFDAMWVTGEDEGLYDDLMTEITEGAEDFPIVFDSMALDWDQVDALKGAIYDHCPDIHSYEYRRHPERHYYCDR